MKFFVLTKKLGPFLDPFFGPKFGNFRSKIKFLDIFFETTYQICLKLGQKLGTIALNHRMAVLCLRKFLFWRFWPFLGQKYIACGDIFMFFYYLAAAERPQHCALVLRGGACELSCELSLDS